MRMNTRIFPINIDRAEINNKYFLSEFFFVIIARYIE